MRYLQEYAPLGTAGGLHHFRDQIRAGSPDAFIVMNGDVCAEFPLQEMLEFHASKDQAVSFPTSWPLDLPHLQVATILGTEATRQQSVNYGCVVEDKTTHTVLHYVEKPSSYISCIINCGVYVFSSQIFPMLAVGSRIEKLMSMQWLQGVFNSKQGAAGKGGDETIWLEKDLLGPLAGTNTAFLFQVSCHGQIALGNA